jgi:hypothetical protein
MTKKKSSPLLLRVGKPGLGRHRQRTFPGFIFTSPNDDDHFDQLTFEVQAIVYQMP